VSITADARRRFERAPAGGRLSDLTLPSLDTYPDNPGEWFADGAPRWTGLESLGLRGYAVRPEWVARVTGMPFWGRLTALDVSLSVRGGEDTTPALRDRLPDSLRTFRLASNQSPGPALDPLFDRLAGLPLQGLHIHPWARVSPAALGRLLGEGSRCDLRDLTLSGCDLTEEHVRVIAGAARLRSLNLSGNGDFSPAAAEALFTSGHLRSLVELNLDGTQLGPAGVKALAAADGWDQLRTLTQTVAGVRADDLVRLFESPALRQLAALRLEFGDDAAAAVTPRVAAALTRLPHLASLRLTAPRVPAEVRGVLAASESLAWPLIACTDDPVEYGFDPKDRPPLDEELADVDWQ
jgi:hypothetical protein